MVTQIHCLVIPDRVEVTSYLILVNVVLLKLQEMVILLIEATEIYARE